MHPLGERLVGAAERARRHAPQFFVAARPGDAAADHVPVEGAHAGRVERQPQLFFALAQDLALAANLELRHHLPAERGEPVRLRVGQQARHAVRHSEKADRLTVRCAQRRAGVQARLRRTGHERVVGRPGIGARVGDDERISTADDVHAERPVARRVLRGTPRRGGVPLARVVHERDERHPRLADGGGEFGQLAQGRVGGGVGGDVLVESCEAAAFIGGAGGESHRQPAESGLKGIVSKPSRPVKHSERRG